MASEIDAPKVCRKTRAMMFRQMEFANVLLSCRMETTFVFVLILVICSSIGVFHFEL